MNTEPKFRRAPANTLIKMAEKRAHVQATLDATFSSELFTQDIEDYERKSETPASTQQKKEIQKLKDDISLDVSAKTLESAQNFLMTEELQTSKNAGLLITKLKASPKRKPGQALAEMKATDFAE